MKRNPRLIILVAIIAVMLAGCGKTVHIHPEGIPLSASPEDYEEITAYYYVNETGRSSKYISYGDCVEIGEGTIAFDKNLDVLIVRNDPGEVEMYLTYIPDYTFYLNENEDIEWKTIYRSRGVYRVIGEVVEASSYSEEYSEPADEPGGIISFLSNALFGTTSDESASFDGFSDEAEVSDEASDEEIIVEETIGEEIIEEEIVEEQVRNEFDSVADMIAYCPPADLTVYTRGYYTDGDGGGATYIISYEKGNIYESFENGLYANLQYDERINLKQLGAKGDGLSDDSVYLEKAFASGIKEIQIPNGVFNLSNKSITVPGGVRIMGNGASESVLMHLNFTAPEGLYLSDLTCDGAAERKMSAAGMRMSQTVMFDASPKGAQKICYINCTFKNADCISYAFANQDGYLLSDEVTDCTFENIGRAAVFHSCNADYSNYCNNTFSNIGSDKIDSGVVTGIWIGDVSNITYTRSKNIVISGNRFENLYTADDLTSIHSINANFIAIRGDAAVISGNHIENLYGYGSDREAVYTKVTDLKIDDNTIINGGCGEGYICNKASTEDIYAIISNNRFSGDFGCGIRLYGPGLISQNTIEIKNCTSAITVTSKGGASVDYPVEIQNNTITCGSDETYYANGKAITDYNTGKLINVYGAVGKVSICDNTITATGTYTAYVTVANSVTDATVNGNTIDTAGHNGIGVYMYCSSNCYTEWKLNISVRNNNIILNSGQKGVYLNFPEQITTRSIAVTDNDFNYSNSSGYGFPLTVTVKGTYRDTLEMSGNTSNTAKAKTYVYHASKKLINKDSNFATVTKK